MIDPAQIPPEVVEAYLRCGDVSAAEAIAAALSAWPGAYDTEDFYAEKYCRILPLTAQEGRDD